MSFARPARAPDWVDTLSGPVRGSYATAREVYFAALERTPLWMDLAMRLRTLAVKPFGLKTEIDGEGPLLTRLPVVEDTPERFETGLSDRHLDFTVATRLQAGVVDLTTRVWFNRPLGRAYLAAVMPGHILITRQLLARVAHPIARRTGLPEGETA